MNDRTCPCCGLARQTTADQANILACLNNISGDVYEARCHCRNCDTVWDEYYNQATDEIVIDIVIIGSKT